MHLKKILSSPLWFLVGSILFLISGLRLILQTPADVTGVIIHWLACLIFLLGFIGQKYFNKN